jgi:hypothetical protein
LKPLDRSQIAADFAAAVNMDAEELEAWLETPDSLRVGFKRDGCESVGHAAGRRIVQILRHGPSGDSDYVHMHKVVGFIRRHRAQEPGNLVSSRWRYSLMNWGHDPLKA